MNTLLALWRMARPLQLVSILLVYLTGNFAALAQGTGLSLSRLIWGWVALLLISISIHYANEYADYETDRLTSRTAFSGGSGVLPSGMISRSAAWRAAQYALLIGLSIALAGVFIGAMTLASLIILLMGAFGGWMYSVGPLKLAWRGWGEVDNALLGGLLLPLYGFSTQSGAISGLAMVSFLPFTLLVFTNLLATTWADRQADAMVGKRTLATFVQSDKLRVVYAAALVGSLLVFVAVIEVAIPALIGLMALPILPLMLWGTFTYTRSESPQPSVLLMVAFLLAQLVGWGWAAAGL